MDVQERFMLFRRIMWDYHFSAEDIDDVLYGKKDEIGHYNKDRIVIKLLESYSWFTIVQLFSPDELRQLLSDEVVQKLRFKSLKTKYEFVQKRLQKLVPITK